MIDKITKDLITKFIIEINKPENKSRLENDIITPIFTNFAYRIYPYVLSLFIMFSLNLILIIIILVLHLFH